MIDRLFTYGTLSIPKVMELVAGESFPSASAELHGYARYRIHSRPYPGVIKAQGSSVAGVLHYGIDAQALRRLDYFEDSEYCREVLTVELQDGSSVDAQVYVVPESKRSLCSSEQWCEASFIEERLAAYLENAAFWMRMFSDESAR